MEGLENQSLGMVDYLGYLYIPVAVRHRVKYKMIMMTLSSFKSYVNDRLVYFMMTILWCCSKIWVLYFPDHLKHIETTSPLPSLSPAPVHPPLLSLSLCLSLSTHTCIHIHIYSNQINLTDCKKTSCLLSWCFFWFSYDTVIFALALMSEECFWLIEQKQILP